MIIVAAAAAAVLAVVAVTTDHPGAGSRPGGGVGAATSSVSDPQVRAAPPATPRPRATPGTRPGPSSTGSPLDRTLAGNSLYRLDLRGHSVRCRVGARSPRPPLRDNALAPYLREVMDCLVRAFAPPLAAAGFTVTAPKIRTYRGTVKTPCGTYGERFAPAYYCSVTQTIYWPETGDDGREAYTLARLGYVGLAAHEFGHHLQAVTGMLDDYGAAYHRGERGSSRDQLSRRLELQAECFEGVFLALTTGSLRPTARDRAQLRTWHGFTGDEDPPASRKPDHGSSAAQIRWLERGLSSADFGRCNTWRASQKSVT